MSGIKTYNQTIDFLADGRMYEALALLKSQIGQLQNWPLMDQCVRIEENYGWMLKYFAEGVADDSRDKVYRGLVKKVLAVADRVRLETNMETVHNEYYSKLRTQSFSARTLSYYISKLESGGEKSLFDSILNSDNNASDRSRQSMLEGLFDAIWVAQMLTDNEKADLARMFESKNFELYEKEWMVSALTLSLLYCYDTAKLELLVNLYDCEDSHIECRAIVGVALAAMYHRKRMMLDTPHELFDFIPNTSGTWSVLQLQLFNTYNTKRIRRQMDNDLMPMLFQLQNKVKPEELQDILEDESSELPPGIDEDLLKRIHGKLHSISDQLASGLDIHYAYFARLKSFPFFNNVCNWFKPFVKNGDPAHTSETRYTFLMADPKVCDSDRYSLLNAFSHLPDNIRDMLDKQLESMMPGNMEMEHVGSFVEQYSEFNFESMSQDCLAFAPQYLQDLYRFFEIKMADEVEGNPFKDNPDFVFVDSPLIQMRVAPKDYTTVATEAYNQRLYHQALRLMGSLKTDHKFTRDENLICGFCQAMLHDYESAIEHFEAIGPVELMSDDVQALLATCYDSAGYFDSAIEVYVFLAEKQSYALNNYNYALALSHGGYFDQAQDVLFEEDFLRPGQPKVERLLAWCSLKSANAEQAAKYYEKIINESAPKASDYFNAGHAALALGDVPKAVNYYKMSAATRASESANPSPIRLSDEDNAMLDALKVPRLVARLAIEAANSKDAR